MIFIRVVVVSGIYRDFCRWLMQSVDSIYHVVCKSKTEAPRFYVDRILLNQQRPRAFKFQNFSFWSHDSFIVFIIGDVKKCLLGTAELLLDL